MTLKDAMTDLRWAKREAERREISSQIEIARLNDEVGMLRAKCAQYEAAEAELHAAVALAADSILKGALCE